jgi:hypothetical protein
VTNIPNNGKQMIRYYGYNTIKSRGMRKKVSTDDQVPPLIGRLCPLWLLEGTGFGSSRKFIQ